MASSLRHAATEGIGALGLQLAVFGVEPVGGVPDVFKDVSNKTVDGGFDRQGGDVVQPGLGNELQ